MRLVVAIVVILFPIFCMGQYHPEKDGPITSDGVGFRPFFYNNVLTTPCTITVGQNSATLIASGAGTMLTTLSPMYTTVTFSHTWLYRVNPIDLLRVKATNNTGAQRVGYVYLQNGACRDTITITQLGK